MIRNSEREVLDERIRALEAEVAKHRRAEIKYASFFHLSPDPMAMIDMETWHCIDANKAYARCTGYSREELIGVLTRDFHLWVNSEDLEKVSGEISAEGEVGGIEVMIRQRSGQFLTLFFSARMIEMGQQRYLLLFGKDITESKRVEETLYHNEEKYRTILENIQESYFESDLQGRIIFVNEMVSKHLGYAKEELLGKKSEFLYDEKGWKKTLQAYRRLYQTGEPFKLLESEFISKDGRRGIYELSVDLIRDSRGAPTGFCGVSRDITERKLLAERLNRAEKMEALGTMAGGVAHDLNNVLGAVVGYSESLAQRLPEKTLERADAETILQAGWRCTAIVDDLLTLARRGVNVSEVTDLNQLVFDYLRTPEFTQLLSRHPNVRIRTQIEEELEKIKGSPVHLTKTIMNLVANAMEAITGSGSVTIRTENLYLDSPLGGYDEMKEGNYIVLTVSDTGAGISAKDLGKIFEPFYTKKVMGRSGTGLGLAVVWGAVKDHNGFIDVQSEEGKGTAFKLYFPVTSEKMMNARETIPPARYMSQGESILVVDDVKEQRELAARMLGQLGYQVESVPGGEEAIEYLKSKKADLIVLDMIMDPGIDGMETYQRILEMNPGQKAVMVSGFSDNDQVLKAREMGAGAFVRKPYMLEKIGLAVRRELDQKSPQPLTGAHGR